MFNYYILIHKPAPYCFVVQFCALCCKFGVKMYIQLRLPALKMGGYF